MDQPSNVSFFCICSLGTDLSVLPGLVNVWGMYEVIFMGGSYCTGCDVSISYPEHNKFVGIHNQDETLKQHHTSKAAREQGGRATHFMRLSTTWRWVASFTIELLYLRGRVPVRIRSVVLKTYGVCGPLSNTLHSKGALSNKMHTDGPLIPPHLNYLHINLKQTQNKLPYIKCFNACRGKSRPQGHIAAGRIRSIEKNPMTSSGIESSTFRLVS
jgi:hypothetical protein